MDRLDVITHLDGTRFLVLWCSGPCVETLNLETKVTRRWQPAEFYQNFPDQRNK